MMPIPFLLNRRAEAGRIVVLSLAVAAPWLPGSMLPATLEAHGESHQLLSFMLVLCAVFGRVWTLTFVGGRKDRELCTVVPLQPGAASAVSLHARGSDRHRTANASSHRGTRVAADLAAHLSVHDAARRTKAGRTLRYPVPRLSPAGARVLATMAGLCGTSHVAGFDVCGPTRPARQPLVDGHLVLARCGRAGTHRRVVDVIGTWSVRVRHPTSAAMTGTGESNCGGGYLALERRPNRAALDARRDHDGWMTEWHLSVCSRSHAIARTGGRP